jgi:hypothetical protein
MAFFANPKWIEELQTDICDMHYNFAKQTGQVVMPPGCCADMMGIIAFFQRIDPDVEQIRTFSGTKEDTTYFCTNGCWRARQVMREVF